MESKVLFEELETLERCRYRKRRPKPGQGRRRYDPD